MDINYVGHKCYLNGEFEVKIVDPVNGIRKYTVLKLKNSQQRTKRMIQGIMNGSDTGSGVVIILLY